MKRRILLLAAIFMAGTSLGAMLALPAHPAIPIAEPIASAQQPDEPIRAFGWVDDPHAAQSHRFCRFCDTEAFGAEYTGPDDVFLWEACRKATGDLLAARDQKGVGSCCRSAPRPRSNICSACRSRTGPAKNTATWRKR